MKKRHFIVHYSYNMDSSRGSGTAYICTDGEYPNQEKFRRDWDIPLGEYDNPLIIFSEIRSRKDYEQFLKKNN